MKDEEHECCQGKGDDCCKNTGEGCGCGDAHDHLHEIGEHDQEDSCGCGHGNGHSHEHGHSHNYSIEDIAYNNHYVLNTLIAVLIEKKLITEQELEDAIKKVTEQAKKQ